MLDDAAKTLGAKARAVLLFLEDDLCEVADVRSAPLT